MSDEAPWLETWEVDEDGSILSGPRLVVPSEDIVYRAETRLMAAAPQLARALAAVEWGSGGGECPACEMAPLRMNESGAAHFISCIIDAALTAAGLDTQEKREEARRAGQ